MRLTCPNCGAQYEVADDVIPPAGRDVQCSNCAHTWFETPSSAAKDETAPRRPRPAPEPAEESAAAPAPRAPGNRKTVDPNVADILREEAAREASKRRAEAPARVETQSDLGLAEPAKAPRRPTPQPAPRTAAAAAGAAVAASAGAAATVTADKPRRPKLPEIDDVDTDLGTGDTRDTHREIEISTEAKARRGFRRGFFLSLLLIAFLAAVYMQAPQIKAAVPALAPVLDGYVALVDQARVWLDTTVRGLVDRMSGEA